MKRLLLITLILGSFLAGLVLVALQLSTSNKSQSKKPFYQGGVSNGTHEFSPTTIFISLDGFRPDYLKRNLTPSLQSLIDSGVSAPYLTPCFPTVTFPNHWTMVTGLYPESHGIVSNSFWDPELKEHYYYTNRTVATNPVWYGGSPLWSIAEEHGIKTAVHMWPGSETYLFHPEAFASTLNQYKSQPADRHPRLRMAPSHVDKFVKNETISKKASRALQWLDSPTNVRPQLIFEYVPNIDAVGHSFGPDSAELDRELGTVDELFTLLLNGLDARNLTDIVNIVVVSDHGMAQTANERLVYIEDILGDTNMQKIQMIEGWPLSGLRLVEGANATAMFEDVQKRHQSWPPNTRTGQAAVLPDKKPPWEVYLRDGNMPARFHFAANHRIAPLWIMPKVGWAIVTKDEYPPDNFPENGYHPKGVHGYDNEAHDMRAIFVAHGPGFARAGLHGAGRGWSLDVHNAEIPSREGRVVDKRGMGVIGRQVVPFANVELYSIIAELVFGPEYLAAGDVLGAHNGTLGGINGLVLLDPGSSDAQESTLILHPTPSRQVIKTLTVVPQPHPTDSAVPEHDLPSAASATAPSATTSVENPASSGEAEGEDKPTLDHKPNNMTWWEWAKWRAQQLKDQLETWWGKVWDDTSSN